MKVFLKVIFRDFPYRFPKNSYVKSNDQLAKYGIGQDGN